MTIAPRRRVLTVLLAALLSLPGWLAPSFAQANPDDRAVAAQLLKAMSDASFIPDGTGDQIVYFFFDPNCPYCHRVYDRIQKIRADFPGLQFRWVPLGMLSGTSKTKAAAIIQAPDPLAAFHQSESNFGFLDSDTGGGIAPAHVVEPATQTILDENLSILQGANLYGIPVVVFQADDGKAFYFSGERTEAQLREIFAHVAKGSFAGGTAITGHTP
ncbi:thioredoxin fold domain-containing protein [Halothiobacillus sp. DCM-1]|uniref:thioredoxin fold domain-containing protein n=1 Tax=Halothiobacillus sp. DCM-1 TaxID=3112558 RepID=UPI0032522296